jgi:hypothetical protein
MSSKQCMKYSRPIEHLMLKYGCLRRETNVTSKETFVSKVLKFNRITSEIATMVWPIEKGMRLKFRGKRPMKQLTT